MDQADHREEKKLWSPVFLRPLTLALFGCTYMTTAIALLIIAWYSASHSGICNVHPTDHYLWQYAPTAVFTFMSVLWGQVDYRARLMMPWILMAHEPQIAPRNILLDYVSPNIATALAKSVKAKDFHVSLALFGTVLNTLLIIASTGLFTSANINVAHHTTPLRGGKAFSSLGFNASLISRLPVARVFGIESMNMSYPFGTNQDYATEIPPARDDNSIVDLLSQVNIISAYAECETAHLQSRPGIRGVDAGMYNYIDSDNNTVTVYAGDSYSITDPQGNTKNYRMLPYLLASEGPYGHVWTDVRLSSDTCSSIAATGNEEGPPWPILDQSPQADCNDDDYRFVFGFYSSMNRSAFLVCKPGYKFQTAEMTYLYNMSSGTGRWKVGDPASNGELSSLTAQTLFEGFATAIAGFNKTQILGSSASGGNTDFLFDPHLLKERFLQLYASATAQIANSYLLVDQEKEFEVKEIKAQDRLQLRGYGLWLTEVMLLLVGLISIALSYLFRRPVTPRDPGSITGVATILARSQEFVGNLSGSGLEPLSAFRKKFAMDTFHTETITVSSETTSGFCIRQTTPSDPVHLERQSTIQSGFAWYYPFIISTKGRACIIVTALMIIAALETLYRISTQNFGFVTFMNHQYDEYIWRFVPATILVLFGLLVNALEFELKTFQPFFNLKQGSVPSAKSTDRNYHGLLGIHGLLDAMRQQHYCLVAMFIGTMSAQFLTIISSGLFTAQKAIEERPIHVQTLDHVDLNAFNDINRINYQENGMMAATLVLDEHMDLPRWTYDSFVVPEMSLPTPQDNKINYDGLQITVPATRAVANCTEIRASNVSVANVTHEISIDFESLSPCGNGTMTSAIIDGSNLSGQFAFWNDRSGDIYHCPEYFVLAGNLDQLNSTWKPLALHCKPYLESVDARIELTYPDLMEVRTFTPLLDESSRKFFTPAEIPRIGRNLLAPYTNNSRSGSNLQQTVGTHYAVADIKIPLTDGTVDGFFGTIVQRGTPLSTLTTDIESLASAVEDMYPRVVAQALNFNRVATNGSILSGTAHLRNKLRLTQNGPSTRALQALLAVMALSTVATFTLGSTKHVLPKNPRSIAAVASLLAGSSMLDKKVIPPGSEWRTDKDLKRLGLFKDHKFSMGWWGSGNEDLGSHGEKGRFGIDIGVAEWYDVHEVKRRAPELDGAKLPFLNVKRPSLRINLLSTFWGYGKDRTRVN